MELLHVDPEALARWLADRGWIAGGRSVTGIEPAGEGNMNITRRVFLDDDTSIIVKQAVPFVAKYPDIPAPVERGDIEAGFYRATAGTVLDDWQPRLIGHDSACHVLVLEDLGNAADFTVCYASRALPPAACRDLESYLDALHGLEAEANRFGNPSMRALNHEHIFVIPFAGEAALDLDAITPGLAAVREDISRRDRTTRSARTLGKIYLGEVTAGIPSLLHGDFFPGSWLNGTRPTVRVIDPEFAFFGPREFDLGVFMAHRLFIGESVADVTRVAEGRDVDSVLARAFAGVELIRRLLGVAQLPLERSLAEKRELIELGSTWLEDLTIE